MAITVQRDGPSCDGLTEDDAEPASSSTNWGSNFIAERLELLNEFERANERLRRARITGDRDAIERTERYHFDLFGACAIHRAEAVNGFIASLRMACQDDPGTVAHHLNSIVDERIRPVAEAMARLEARMDELLEGRE